MRGVGRSGGAGGGREGRAELLGLLPGQGQSGAGGGGAHGQGDGHGRVCGGRHVGDGRRGQEGHPLEARACGGLSL